MAPSRTIPTTFARAIPASLANASKAATSAALRGGTCDMMGSAPFTVFDWLVLGFIAVLAIFTVVYIFLSRRHVSKIENFANESEKTHVKYFKMPSCPYCKKFDESWHAVSNTMAGESIAFEKPIDVTKPTPETQADVELARTRCNGFPCFMTLRGDKVSAVNSGYKDPVAFERWITEHQ